MKYILKPLKQFRQHDGSLLVVSPTHEYIIRDKQTNYRNLHSNQVGIKYCKNEYECLEWINNVHVPSKLKEYFYVSK